MRELFTCTARGEEFSGELKGNMAVIAHSEYSNDLYALSVAGHERTISACVAGLSKGGSIEFFWKGCQLLMRTVSERRSYYVGNGADHYRMEVHPDAGGLSVKPLPGGYTCHRQHLGYDTWHLLAVSRNPRLLIDGGDEALWRILRGDQFTTPLLRSWVPELRREMLEAGLLKDLVTVGLQSPAQLVLVEDLGLDALVEAGIRAGRLQFTQGEAAEKVA